MYTFDSRVRYSETDEEGRLTVTGIINYMQDCAARSLRGCGRRRGGIWANISQNLAIVLTGIVIDRYPRLGNG